MTLTDLLIAGPDDAVAIAAPGRPSMDYRGLRELVAPLVGNDLVVGVRQAVIGS